MTLKRQVAIGVALAYSIIFGLASISVFVSFSSFRMAEFKGKLEEKALTTAKLLVEVKQIDKQLLSLIDKNTIHQLYNEKTLVFDSNFSLIYSSIDDANIHYDLSDLKRLQHEKDFFRTDGEKDLLGLFYSYNHEKYYILVAAEDKYGNNKLQYLFSLLMASFLISSALVWLISFNLIKRLLKPLDNFEGQITAISANKLNIQLVSSGKQDEIHLLTSAFNKLLERLENAFEVQKEFAASASHELRTPLTRMAFQVENMLQNHSISELQQNQLKDLLSNIYLLSDLINSLLLLSKIESTESYQQLKSERVDEIIFSSFDKIKSAFPDFNLTFSIYVNSSLENELIVNSIPGMLEIAFMNLLKNACIYSTDKKASLEIYQNDESQIIIKITNNGQTMNEHEAQTMFKAFVRGNNSGNIRGSGLGLRIVRHILSLHGADIAYKVTEESENLFQITFHIK